MTVSRRARLATALAVAATAALAACSSSGNGGGTTTDSGGASDAGGGNSSSAPAPTGTPVKIMGISSFDNPVFAVPQVKTAMTTAVAAVNSAGGVGGRPLQVSFCDDQLSPNGATTCAQQAISSKVAAVVGGVEVVSNALPVLQKAGVPYVGGAGIGPDELTSSVSFPLASGSPGWYYGIAGAAIKAGKTHIAIIRADNASASESAQWSADAIKAAGLSPVRTVVAPAGQTDYSSQAAAAVEGNVDAVLLVVPPEQSTPLIRALRQGGFTGTISALATNFSPSLITSLGSDAEGSLAVSQLASVTSTDNPAVTQFVKAMKAQDSKATIDELGLISWTAVKLFTAVAAGLPTIDAASVLHAFQTLSKPVDLGTTAPYVVVGAHPPAQFPRLFNPTVTISQVHSGTLSGSSDYVDPFASS